MAAPANGLWRRRWVLAGVAVATVLVHAWGLGAVGGAAARAAEPSAAARPAPLTVRSVAAQPVPAALAQPVAVAGVERLPVTPAPSTTLARGHAGPSPAAPPPAAQDATPAAGDAPAAEADAAPAPADSSAPTDPPPAAAEPDQTDPQTPPPSPEGEAGGPLTLAAATAGMATAAAAAPAAARAETVQVPVYATRLAAPFSARYQLKRGLISGSGTLRWSPSADGRYEARLDGSVAGFNVLDWTSTGAIDRAGVAPERFLIRRRGKDAQAANFQRAAGKISYSGPSVQFDLPPGAQDRLSWMLQIGGVLNASPKRFNVGSRIVFFVSGARGDADVWQFNVVGLESVPIGGDRETMALKLVREPRKAYDTHVEIWLDPANEHRPVKARLATAGNDDALELLPAE